MVSRVDYSDLARALHDRKPVLMPYQDEDLWKASYRSWERACRAVWEALEHEGSLDASVFMLWCFDGPEVF